MPLVGKVEAFLPVYEWIAGADESLIHALLNDDVSRTSVTDIAFF